MSSFQARRGWLRLDGWSGRVNYEVEVVRETPTRYRIRALSDMQVPGRYRILYRGQEQFVPKHAISFERQAVESVEAR